MPPEEEIKTPADTQGSGVVKEETISSESTQEAPAENKDLNKIARTVLATTCYKYLYCLILNG